MGKKMGSGWRVALGTVMVRDRCVRVTGEEDNGGCETPYILRKSSTSRKEKRWWRETQAQIGRVEWDPIAPDDRELELAANKVNG